MKSDARFQHVRPYQFLNNSGETIPPRSCVVITGASTRDDDVLFSIRKPITADEVAQNPQTLAFTNDLETPNNSYGMLFINRPAVADVAFGAIGDLCGPVAGSWSLGLTGIAFEVVGSYADTGFFQVSERISLVEVVRVTSNVPVSGLYPGIVQRYNPATNTWSDIATCWVKDANS